MRFSKQEIMFLTSISRGRVPLGVECPLPETVERERYITETIAAMKEKGIIGDDHKLTKEGAIVISLWERYRNSKRHIRLNHVHAAILPENVLITVIETEDGYEVGAIRSELFMLELAKHMEYLCLEEKAAERGKWQDIGEEEWKAKLEEMDNGILLYEFLSGRLQSEKVYFWKDETGYLFHKTNGRIRTLSPGVMRKQIYRILKEA